MNFKNNRINNIYHNKLIRFLFVGGINTVFGYCLFAFFILRKLIANSYVRSRQRANNINMFVSNEYNNNNVNNINQNILLINNENLKKLNTKLLDNMLKTKLTGVKYEEKNNYFKNDCTICLEEFSKSKKLVSILECKHIFHNNCLIDWINKNILNPKCPNCNFFIFEQKDIEVNHNPQLIQNEVRFIINVNEIQINRNIGNINQIISNNEYEMNNNRLAINQQILISQKVNN